MGEKITITALVKRDIATVWSAWTQPQHVMGWNFADPSWHCPGAVNDPRPGGTFSFTMAARDGSMSFDFGGVYESVEPGHRIVSVLGDGRRTEVIFEAGPEGVQITETFEAESENPPELQRSGWQSILNNYRDYTQNL